MTIIKQIIINGEVAKSEVITRREANKLLHHINVPTSKLNNTTQIETLNINYGCEIRLFINRKFKKRKVIGKDEDE